MRILELQSFNKISMFTLLVLAVALPTALARQGECLPRSYGVDNIVCVCNARHCDAITPPPRTPPSNYVTYATNRAGLRFQVERGQFRRGHTFPNQIRVHENDRYQTIVGWGGAFTDSTGINLASLDQKLQEKLLRSYFSEEGLEYGVCRVPIAGTDFSVRAYSYNDGPPDPQLVNFQLASEDYLYKIPYIKRALNLRKGDIKLISSAWLAPKWMKTNGEYYGPGYLLEDMYQPWANYLVKFLDEYQRSGINFWGITTGNEPVFLNTLVGVYASVVGWNSTDMGRWILNNLGPALKHSRHKNVKLLILDDQIQYLPSWVQEALENPIARQYVDGVAFHWYFNTDYPPSLLTQTQEVFPEKFILSTEACNGFYPGSIRVILGSWERGENYSSDIIRDLNHWVTGWIDWNMALDLDGGPNYLDNFVDSPILVNASAGEFYKQPMYYHLGHFTKFIPSGSRVIGSSVVIDGNVTAVAVQRPDQGIAVVILNQDEKPVSLSLVDSRRGNVQLKLTEKSITTALYW